MAKLTTGINRVNEISINLDKIRLRKENEKTMWEYIKEDIMRRDYGIVAWNKLPSYGDSLIRVCPSCLEEGIESEVDLVMNESTYYLCSCCNQRVLPRIL